MNHEVEKYVGELKELRSEVETMKERIKDLECELDGELNMVSICRIKQI